VGKKWGEEGGGGRKVPGRLVPLLFLKLRGTKGRKKRETEGQQGKGRGKKGEKKHDFRSVFVGGVWGCFSQPLGERKKGVRVGGEEGGGKEKKGARFPLYQVYLARRGGRKAPAENKKGRGKGGARRSISLPSYNRGKRGKRKVCRGGNDREGEKRWKGEKAINEIAVSTFLILSTTLCREGRENRKGEGSEGREGGG